MMREAGRFYLTADEALAVLGQVLNAISDWRTLALGKDVGMQKKDLEDIESAFEHADLETAKVLLK